MYLTHYTLFDDCVHLTLAGDQDLTVYFNAQSGQIHAVRKSDGAWSIQHTGIYLGTDCGGTTYYLHNHLKARCPELVTKSEFAQDQEIFLYPGITTNDSAEIIRIGLEQLLAGKPYSLLTYNCEGFVNTARQNKNRSEAVEKVAGLAFLAMAGVALHAFMTPDKRLRSRRLTRRRYSKRK